MELSLLLSMEWQQMVDSRTNGWQCCKTLACDDLDPLLVWVNKENLMEFSIYYTLLIQLLYGLCTIFSYSIMWHDHVILPKCMTIICDIVMWHFSTLLSCIVSPKRKKKKRNINNNLAILPSHDRCHNGEKWQNQWWKLFITFIQAKDFWILNKNIG